MYIVTKKIRGRSYWALYKREDGRQVYVCNLPRSKFKRKPTTKAALAHYAQTLSTRQQNEAIGRAFSEYIRKKRAAVAAKRKFKGLLEGSVKLGGVKQAPRQRSRRRL